MEVRNQSDFTRPKDSWRTSPAPGAARLHHLALLGAPLPPPTTRIHREASEVVKFQLHMKAEEDSEGDREADLHLNRSREVPNSQDVICTVHMSSNLSNTREDLSMQISLRAFRTYQSSIAFGHHASIPGIFPDLQALEGADHTGCLSLVCSRWRLTAEQKVTN
eukprot:766748-Hanusia_phi.AAC.17